MFQIGIKIGLLAALFVGGAYIVKDTVQTTHVFITIIASSIGCAVLFIVALKLYNMAIEK